MDKKTQEQVADFMKNIGERTQGLMIVEVTHEGQCSLFYTGPMASLSFGLLVAQRKISDVTVGNMDAVEMKI